MIFWKSWFDLRGRFFFCLLLVTVAVCPESIFIAIHEARGTLPASVQEAGVVAGTTEAAEFTLDAFVRRWYSGSEMAITLLTIVLAVGGTMSEAQTRSNLFTLSLPVRRRRWLVGHWCTAAGMSLALVLYSAVIFLSIGFGFGVPVPQGVIFTGILTLMAWVSIWIGPSMLATSLTREPVKAALLVIAVLIGTTLLAETEMVGAWHLNGIRRLETWQAGVPWISVLLGLIVGGGGFFWAARRFEKADY